MTTEEQNEEVNRRPIPYTWVIQRIVYLCFHFLHYHSEKIQELDTKRNPPIVYKPATPREVFQKVIRILNINFWFLFKYLVLWKNYERYSQGLA